MPSAYDAAQAAVAGLVERFARNLAAYRRAPLRPAYSTSSRSRQMDWLYRR